ncbi:MAG: hypothetical protein GOMPHAMPRED_007683 [Gomphillus americanus]|uniref:RRM domain-containing protein n=1 Tax=Gomphillus americanus TaxID=1940652 RepID=A0A8H3ETU0_9LECA|nr:MAG: hypothetical protein GOMPHAMPRED_007683 [Gomphillus americanus]
MAGQEDNFEIDIYGDAEEGYQNEEQQMEETSDHHNQMENPSTEEPNEQHEEHQETAPGDTVESMNVEASKPAMQNLKRKEGVDERPLDSGATAALTVSELHWWINDDDIRGWANQCQCEDELREITFSEHKVNGKSKGQVYLLFDSPQAATAVRQKIDSFADGSKYRQKFSVGFSNPTVNPYKTLPKDGNTRTNQQGRTSSSTTGNSSFASNNTSQGGFTGNFRGGRGGYNSRGGSGGFNRGGFQQPAAGNFSAGYQNPTMAMQGYNNFGNRGGMMGGMRGGMNMRGRGGLNQGMMTNWGGMGVMPNMMSMPNIGAGMNMQGFQNAGFYPQQGAVGDAWNNPHGGKRQRQE